MRNSLRFFPFPLVLRVVSSVALCVALCRPAAAADDPAAAEALFLQGRQAFEQGDCETASAKFQESYRLDPAAGTLMNLATCEERLGKLASAWQHWQEALQRLPPQDDRVPFAQSRVQALETQLPYLTLRLAPGAPDSTYFVRNGVQLRKAARGTALPVDPGEQVITIEAPGYASQTFRIDLGVGEHRELVVRPGKKLPPAPPKESESNPRRTWAFISGGLGLAGAATGVVTGLLLPSRRAAVEANCEDGLCNQAGLDAAAEGQSLLVANTVGWAVGFVGLGTGTYLFLTSGSPTASSGVGVAMSSERAVVSYGAVF